MFKTWFYTNIYNVYTNYCLILQIFKVWAVVYLSYFITSVLFVMLWVDECLQAVVIHLLSVYISITPVKVIQLTFSYFLSFLLLPSLTTFDLYSIFTFFLLLIFVYFIMLKKSACLRGHQLFEKSKMASILLVVLMVCICSDR